MTGRERTIQAVIKTDGAQPHQRGFLVITARGRGRHKPITSVVFVPAEAEKVAPQGEAAAAPPASRE